MPFRKGWGNIKTMGYLQRLFRYFSGELLMIKQAPVCFIVAVLGITGVFIYFALIPANKFYYEATINNLTASNKTLSDEKEKLAKQIDESTKDKSNNALQKIPDTAMNQSYPHIRVTNSKISGATGLVLANDLSKIDFSMDNIQAKIKGHPFEERPHKPHDVYITTPLSQIRTPLAQEITADCTATITHVDNSPVKTSTEPYYFPLHFKYQASTDKISLNSIECSIPALSSK